MTPVYSLSDFEQALQAERAVVFIFFAWSKQAERSRQVVEQWRSELTPQAGELNFAVYQLEPDGHPYTWKWVGAARGEAESGENAQGPVLWLRSGSIVAHVQNAAAAGVKTLVAKTIDCFGLKPGNPATGPDLFMRQPAVFDAGLLEILCCPETHQELRLAPAPVLEKLHQRLAAGTLKNRAGRVLDEKIDGGLIRADGRCLYPVRQGIPILLIEEAILLLESS